MFFPVPCSDPESAFLFIQLTIAEPDNYRPLIRVSNNKYSEYGMNFKIQHINIVGKYSQLLTVFVFIYREQIHNIYVLFFPSSIECVIIKFALYPAQIILCIIISVCLIVHFLYVVVVRQIEYHTHIRSSRRWRVYYIIIGFCVYHTRFNKISKRCALTVSR